MVSDRFLDSSLAYQGGARGLGVDEVERDQPLRDRRPGARPHLPARDRPASPRRSAPGRATASRTRARGSSRRCSTPTSGWSPRTRAAGGASTPRARPQEVHADVLRRGRGRPQRGAGVSAVLDGTEDHPHARMVLAAALEAGALARLPVPRAGGHRQAHRRAGVRRRAARRGRSPTRTRVRLRVQHGTHPDLTWVRPRART